MPSLSTHKGDDGATGILGEGRLPKYHPRIEALGTLDEASAALGLARALAQSERSGAILLGVQRDLYALMTEVAATPEAALRLRAAQKSSQAALLEPPRLQWLEAQIEALTTLAPLPAEFILPGDSPSGAALSLARTVVRRAERRVAELLDKGEIKNPLLLQYLNRLSSLCFALELFENQQSGNPTTLVKE